MNAPMKTVIACSFVAVLGGALVRPILATGDSPRAQSPSRMGSTTIPGAPNESTPPKPSPTPAPTDLEFSQPGDFYRLATEYPRRCLKPVAGRGDDVAAYREGTVRIVSTGTGESSSIRAQPPVRWSASGRFLATGSDGHLWTRAGERSGMPSLAGGTVQGMWAWSPISDCAIVLQGGYLAVHVVTEGLASVLDVQVLDFVMSSDGRRLAYVVDDGSAREIVLASLPSGRIDRIARYDATETIALEGVAPREPTVYFRIASGAGALFDDGAPLLAQSRLSARERPRRVAPAGLSYPDFLTWCGRVPLNVVGDDRDTTTNKELATLLPDPATLTSNESVHLSPSCSPDGEFIAVVRAPDGASVDDRRLVVLRRDGSFLQEMNLDSGYADEFPDWGPPGAGLLFVRRPLDVERLDRHELWHAAEGDTPRSLGLLVADLGRAFGYFDWDLVLDWSATPPSGLPR